MRFVVDENVLVVANDLTRRSLGLDPRCPEADDSCGLKCAKILTDLIRDGGVSLDDGLEVLEKYKAHCSFSGQPGVGDAFLRAIYERGYVPDWAERVKIRSHSGYSLPTEFLECAFDNDDHIWVAIAYNSTSHPRIVNAVDSDYNIFQEELSSIGVSVTEICR